MHYAKVDDTRKKYEVRYYWLRAKYPQEYLAQLKEQKMEGIFKNGTYDEVLFDYIQWQGLVFHKIMDVIGANDLLDNVINIKERMPMLFNKLQEEA